MVCYIDGVEDISTAAVLYSGFLNSVYRSDFKRQQEYMCVCLYIHIVTFFTVSLTFNVTDFFLRILKFNCNHLFMYISCPQLKLQLELEFPLLSNEVT